MEGELILYFYKVFGPSHGVVLIPFLIMFLSASLFILIIQRGLQEVEMGIGSMRLHEGVLINYYSWYLSSS